MIRRVINRIVEAQGWAETIAEPLQNLYLAILKPPFLKDLLHGTWFGHALHPALTDLAIGALIAAIALDAGGLWYDEVFLRGADLATLIGFVGMLGAIVTGIADYTGTYGKDRHYGTVHQFVMYSALILYLISVLIRFGAIAGAPQTAFVLAAAGLVVLLSGAFIGGEIVFGVGYMVDRHAYESPEKGWLPLERTDFPDGKPTKVQAGEEAVLVVRRGDTLLAIHDTCSHAACSLSEGKLVDDKIECACHGSRFDLRTGKVARGPATYDQPRFDIKREGGKILVRRATEPQTGA